MHHAIIYVSIFMARCILYHTMIWIIYNLIIKGMAHDTHFDLQGNDRT